MPRDKSLAWAHFEKVGQGLYKQEQVKCKYCRRQFAGQAGKMDAHLKRCTEYAIQRSHEKNGGLPAGPIESYTHRISPEEQARLDKKLALALFAGGLPFATFDKSKKPHMWDFAHNLNTAYKIPDRHKVASELLPACYAECQAKVKTLLSDCQWMNFTCDESDDKARRRITNLSVNLPAHGAIFLRNFHTQAKSQSAEFIKTLIVPEIIDACNGDLARVNSLATDTCSTMRRLHFLMAADPRFSHTFFILCDSHGIQLLIKKILELPHYANILKSAQAVVAAFSYSRLQLGILRHWQAHQYNGKHFALILSVITRWGTQYGLLHSLQRSRDALKLYASDPRANLRNSKNQSLTDLLVQRDFWNCVEDLEEILRPLHIAQKSSESDGSHLGHVTKRWLKMQSSLTQLYESGRHPHLQPIVSPTGIFMDLCNQQTTDIHWVAYALDPANTPAALTPAIQTRVHDFMKRHLTVDDKTWADVVQDYFAFQEKEGAFSRISASVLWEPRFMESPKTFWQYLRPSSPILAGFAVRIFSTPCNSVPSERAFSAMNYIIDKFRASTGVERSNESVYIYMNQKALDRVVQQRQQGLEKLSDHELIEWEEEVLAMMEARMETEQEESG